MYLICYLFIFRLCSIYRVGFSFFVIESAHFVERHSGWHDKRGKQGLLEPKDSRRRL